MLLNLRRARLHFPRPGIIMGIVNLSPDSFSGDGLAGVEEAVARALALAEAGAEIIDLGAESARTNRPAIAAAEESARFLAFLERWQALPLPRPLLSLNTWRTEVIRAVLPHGGELVNDISGLPTPENARLCAEHGAGLVIMHTVGAPKVAHTHVRHEDIWTTLEAFFTAKIALAEQAGLPREALVLDPGIDFAKQRRENLEIYRHLDRLECFGRPVLLPVSRKTVIGDVLGLPVAAERDAGTQACIVQGALQRAHLFRVHHVAAAHQTLRTVEAILAAA